MLLMTERDVLVRRIIQEDAHLLNTVKLVEHRDTEQAGFVAEPYEAISGRVDGFPKLGCTGSGDGEGGGGVLKECHR